MLNTPSPHLWLSKCNLDLIENESTDIFLESFLLLQCGTLVWGEIVTDLSEKYRAKIIIFSIRWELVILLSDLSSAEDLYQHQVY